MVRSQPTFNSSKRLILLYAIKRDPLFYVQNNVNNNSNAAHLFLEECILFSIAENIFIICGMPSWRARSRPGEKSNVDENTTTISIVPVANS